MIKIRKSDGNTIELDKDHSFVEICDTAGHPALVFYENGGAISQITPGSQSSKMYAKKFDIEFVKVIDLKDRYTDERKTKQ